MLHLAAVMQAIPADYFQYYYFRDEVLAELRAKPTTRAEDILSWAPGYWQHYVEQAEQVLVKSLPFAKEGDKGLFVVHSLLGDIYDRKHDTARTVSEYEAAKKACGQCIDTTRGEQLAFFNLGGAYAAANPPRKNEAIQQLSAF